MSANGRKKGGVRPLGAIRQPIQPSYERTTRLTNFSSIPNKNVNQNYEIQGSAMQVPPPKEEKEKEEPRVIKPVVKSGKSDSGSSTRSQEKENIVDKKELSEAKTKIKELKQQISALEREIEHLQEKVRVRDKIISDLKEEHARQEEHYKKLYEKEREDHSRTQSQLSEAETEIEILSEKLKNLTKEMEMKLLQAQMEFDKKLAETIELKDKEIADRDSKLNRLKQQMAESLKGNSWERQQQLEELTKELGRIQDEADGLRIKLKAYKNNKTCGNCQESLLKLEKAMLSIKEKDASIKELQTLCSRFEKQLSQQDELLKLFAEKKGHKVTNFPK